MVRLKQFAPVLLFTALSISVAPAQQDPPRFNLCSVMPAHARVRTALQEALRNTSGNGGFGFQMWITLVNRDGEVCLVAFSGRERGDQWPGSRVISAQKATTANAFSLPAFALSTANLYAATQPNGTLFGLQHSNPVNPEVAYAGNPDHNGQPNDPMVGQRIGGINVFGGGLALYNASGTLIGALGVSGDSSCADHVVAWKVRFALNLDNVPAGPAGTARDNIIHDLPTTATGPGASPSGFGHPTCSEAATEISRYLPRDYPIGPQE